MLDLPQGSPMPVVPVASTCVPGRWWKFSIRRGAMTELTSAADSTNSNVSGLIQRNPTNRPEDRYSITEAIPRAHWNSAGSTVMPI